MAQIRIDHLNVTRKHEFGTVNTNAYAVIGNVSICIHMIRLLLLGILIRTVFAIIIRYPRLLTASEYPKPCVVPS